MMKKAISVLLSLSMLCVATSAMATGITAGAVSSPTKNGVTTLADDPNLSMPGFRPGDTLTFNVNGVTNGNQLTVISYKMGSGNSLSDATVQYINQYELTSTSQPISFKIRDKDTGRYAITFNDGVNPTKTFYYKVGKVRSLELGQKTPNGAGGVTTFITGQGDPYEIGSVGNGKYSISFLARITIDGTEVSLSDIGAHPGFEVTDGTITKNYAFGLGDSNSSKSLSDLDVTGSTAEIAGTYTVLYGLTLYNITVDPTNLFHATAVVDPKNAR